MNRYSNSAAASQVEEEIEAGETAAEAETETETEAGDSNDSVRQYLRQLGAVPLLTREG